MFIQGCPDPTSNLTVRKQQLEFGTFPGAPFDGAMWTIKCVSGYNFPDGSMRKSINCSSFKWIFPQTCTRKFDYTLGLSPCEFKIFILQI